MKTTAVRLYGKNDLRLESFELPAIKPDQILARVVTDSLCMSSYKAAVQGAEHKRVPKDIHQNPIILGHEFCGEILEVGSKWQKQFQPGEKFTIQPALNYNGSLAAPGYSYPHIGGNATYIVIPNEVMACGCLLKYDGEGYFLGSLAEPVSCIIAAFYENYRTHYATHTHLMDIKEGGAMAILAGAGPMGLAAIDYAIHRPKRPRLLVVTDIDGARLARAEEVLPPSEAKRQGVELVYLNTRATSDPIRVLKELAGGGYDDVFVFAPYQALIEQAGSILGENACLNFFAGPTDPNFTAPLNFYDVHYSFLRVTGSSGGNTQDMQEALRLMAAGAITPSAMVTHIGGLDAVADTTKNLPNIAGGKKLIYAGISLPLTALSELEQKGETDPLCHALSKIVKSHNGLWSVEAERYLLQHATKIGG